MSDSSESAEEDDQKTTNYELFRDCVSTAIIQPAPRHNPKPKPKSKSGRKGGKPAPEPHKDEPPKPDHQRDAAELADFIEYLASEIWDCLPENLQNLTYRTWREDELLQTQYTMPLTTDSLAPLNLDPTIQETLQTYNLVAAPSNIDSPLPSAETFLVPILTAYLTPLTTPPPAEKSSKTDHCESCGRWWIPLSYHHLIPRFVHDKAVKRGWHRKEDLNNVAWLCGACHRFVHQFKGHEELAKGYYTVDLLMAEEEVRKWAGWVGKLRWKGGGGRARRS